MTADQRTKDLDASIRGRLGLVCQNESLRPIDIDRMENARTKERQGVGERTICSAHVKRCAAPLFRAQRTRNAQSRKTGCLSFFRQRRWTKESGSK